MPLEGTRNFRDLGGYPTADGGRTRWRLVFRSDSLHSLSDADHGLLRELDVRAVCDLRDDEVVAAQPSRLPETVRSRHHLAVPPVAPGEPSPDDLIRDGLLEELTEADVVALYLDMVERVPRAFGRVLEVVDDTTDGSVVFHCSAGKDRTGLAAALLLAVLGVPDEVIGDDYELTNRYRTPARLLELEDELGPRGVDLARFEPFFVPRRGVLLAALDELRSRHGSLERFLSGPAGVDPDRFSRLRGRLVEGL